MERPHGTPSLNALTERPSRNARVEPHRRAVPVRGRNGYCDVDSDGTRPLAGMKASTSNDVALELDLEPMAIQLPGPSADLHVSM